MRRATALVAAAMVSSAPALADEEARVDASEADRGARESPWNEYDGRYFTLRGGLGFLVDAATYDQDDAGAQQLALDPGTGLRDFRFMAGGRLKLAPRISYTLGYMYDGAEDTWRFRQTGVMVDLDELGGQLFVGRAKEGFSTVRLMTGYDGWTIERSAANDAFLPILADGVRWTGRLAAGHLVYNLGWFVDTRSQYQNFNRNDEQVAARVVALPLAGAPSGDVLHVAVEGRYGLADDGQLQFKAKPENFAAESFAVDTGAFDATSAAMLGVELYYRTGPYVLGSEYYLNRVSSAPAGDPLFHGGDVFVAWNVTGEVRPYQARGALFRPIVPTRSVLEGGPGGIELVLRASHVDVDSAMIAGGKFSRLTPQLNWYLHDYIRFELAYGYGVTERMGVAGATQFLQGRLQIVIN